MNFANWLSIQTMHGLGWALLHFLWQGAGIGAITAAVMAASSRPTRRYAIGLGGLALMLLAPIVTFVAQKSTQPLRIATATHSIATTVSATVAKQASQITASPDVFRWLVAAWLTGVLIFSLRLMGGFVLVQRQRKNRGIQLSEPVLKLCLTIQQRLGLRRAIRFCQCARLESPAVLGWLRPVVMLPFSALTGLSPEQLQSVIAHELAHVKRMDAVANVFQVCVETLLFYHPAVWWLSARVRLEREHCCDDIAVEVCGNPAEYARALTSMEKWRSAPVLAMAATRGPLSARIHRLLGVEPASVKVRGLGATTTMFCVATALVAGTALIAMTRPDARILAATHARAVRPIFAMIAQSSPASRAPAAKPSPTQRSEASAHATGSYIDGLESAGLKNLTADQLIALKIQGVTPEYVRELHQLGMNPSAGEIVSMRVQDVTPEYIRDLRELGLDADQEHIVSLKVQDVTPEYVRAMKAAGATADVDHIISMKVQDVTPEYVQQIRALNLQPSVDQIISMKVQEVTPAYIKAMQAEGLKLNADEIISAKVQGLTPEFVEQAHKHGFQNLSLDKLLQLRRLDVFESKGADL